MTNAEKLDFTLLRQEMREGFGAVTAELRDLGQRVGSLEITRAEHNAVERDRIATSKESLRIREAARVTRTQAVGIATAIVGAVYGLARVLHDLNIFG